MRPSIALAFLLSGFAGLMHEIIWSKLLAGLIGTTAHAQAAVLAVYMGGLALGAMAFGRRSDRDTNPVLVYMVLEVIVAIYCLALPSILAAVAVVYVWSASLVFEAPQLKFALRFLFALSTVLLPAVLMGGTLPLLARAIIGKPQQTRRLVAALYTLNNFGAVLGAAVAGFITLPALGIYPSIVIAAAANVVAALLAWPLARDTKRAISTTFDSAAARQNAYPHSTYTIALIALIMSGFAAMGYEVVFIRVIALAFGSTTHSFTVMLMTFITGIGIGSLLLTRFKVNRPLGLLGVTQLVAAIGFLAATPLMERLPYFASLLRIAAHESGASFLYYQLGKAALCLMVLLVPTICLGAGFPLVASIQARHPDRIGSYIGSTYAWNTLGNVLGVLVTSLVLMPTIGLPGSFHVNVGLSIVAGLMVLGVAEETAPKVRFGAVLVTAAVLATYGGMGRDWTDTLRYGFSHMTMRSGPPEGADASAIAQHPASSFQAWRRAFVLRPQENDTQVLLQEESHANVVVATIRGGARLIVNTKVDASSAGGDLETQLMLAHAPLFMQPDAKSLLIVGYGSGITVGSALRHPVEHADVVEISDGVLKVDRAFAKHNYHALSDPRLRVYIDDAQSFLQTVPRTYDVIISEPSNPWISGIAGLFTVEFFEIARRKLNPGGVFALWFHEYDQSDDAIRLILRTFHSQFPHITLFAEQQYKDIIAIGSVQPLGIDASKLEDRFDLPEVRNDLARIGISNLTAFLTHHAVPSRLVNDMIDAGPINSASHQLLEYISIQGLFSGHSSALVEQSNPLLRQEVGTLVDGYIAHRNNVGEPIRPREFETAIRHITARGHYQQEHRSALTARARVVPTIETPATRPARGAPPDPEQAGYYESVLWQGLASEENQPMLAAAFAKRRDALLARGQTLPAVVTSPTNSSE